MTTAAIPKAPRILARLLFAYFIGVASSAQTGAQSLPPENIPITFYGKVVDQNERPVESARVSFDLVISHFDQLDTETKPVSLMTDHSGLFTAAGFTAYGFNGISITKEGCKFSQRAPRSFVFGAGADYKSDPTKPTVFRMWRSSGMERLVAPSWRGKMACDGRTNRFVLSTGQPSTAGDFEIVCWKNPLNVPPPGNAHFDYKCEIAVVGGGIRPTDDEFTFLAPDSGYVPFFNVDRKKNDQVWKGSVKQEFYIKTADGHFGWLLVEWYAWQTPPTIFRWECAINPSGSRNLER